MCEMATNDELGQAAHWHVRQGSTNTVWLHLAALHTGDMCMLSTALHKRYTMAKLIMPAFHMPVGGIMTL